MMDGAGRRNNTPAAIASSSSSSSLPSTRSSLTSSLSSSTFTTARSSLPTSSSSSSLAFNSSSIPLPSKRPHEDSSDSSRHSKLSRLYRTLSGPSPQLAGGAAHQSSDDFVRSFESFVQSANAYAKEALTSGPATARPTGGSISGSSSAGVSKEPAVKLAQSSSPGRRITQPSTSLKDINADPEVLELRRQVKALTRELTSANAKATEKDIELEKVRKRTELIIEENRTRVETLDKDRLFLLDREKKNAERIKQLEADLTRLQREKDAQKAASLAESVQLKERVSALTEKLSDLKRNADRKSSVASSDVKRLNAELAAMLELREVELQAKQSAFLRIQELEATLSAVEAEMLSVRSGASEKDVITIKKQLQDQLSYISTIESANESLTREVRQLRARRDTVERLREENRLLESQLAHADVLRHKLAQAENETATLRAEKSRWTAWLAKHGDEMGMDAPYELSKALASERLNVAMYMEKVGAEAAKVRGLEAQVLALGVEVQQARSSLASLEKKYEQAQIMCKRVERSRDMAQSQVSFLQEQLKSFDLEEQQMSPNNYDAAKSRRIEEQEARLAELMAHVKRLEAELAQASSAAAAASPAAVAPEGSTNPFGAELFQRIHASEQEIDRLKKENLMLEKEVNALNEQIVALESAVEQNPLNTRILQLADNPESRELAIRQSTLDALRAENASLRDELSKYQLVAGTAAASAGAPAPTTGRPLSSVASLNGGGEKELVPRESLRVAELENERLSKVVTQKDTYILRLKEVCQAKVAEVKEAVNSLLGYKVVFQDNRVRLSSTFADPTDACFLFTSNANDSGTLEIVGGTPEAVAALDAPRTYYIQQRRCVPAFLAAVTMDWWERAEARTSGANAAVAVEGWEEDGRVGQGGGHGDGYGGVGEGGDEEAEGGEEEEKREGEGEEDEEEVEMVDDGEEGDQYQEYDR